MAGGPRRSTSILWACLVLASCLHVIPLKVVDSLSVCKYPAVYAFGDSLIDVGNAIAAFPVQFAASELDPYGSYWPAHSADRLTDGKLFVDFVSYGMSLGPTYPNLRSTATNPMWGTNFATAGATAVNQTVEWKPNKGYSVPFSLNTQLQWLRRYKVRLAYYYSQTYVTQELPSYDSLNASMYVVQAGFQDYFFPLYYQTATTSTSLAKVDSVVSAIGELIDGLVDFGALEILVVNLPPLGCTPALLTLYPGTPDKYNAYGCLTDFNRVSTSHNSKLASKVTTLRTTYPAVKIYFADYHATYMDILKTPSAYNITETLKACCGSGGYYNFNKDVTCAYVGKVGDELLNVTTSCTNSLNHVNFDGIHPSHATNKAAASNAFAGKYITPSGGFGCTANLTRWDSG